ncbi:DUF1398 domain-containing protein [Herbaspirillum robiniae]|uniref:DUF1398 domain-containing protein n=1 Tax=Herbaspirillum robiniae TaxID=2014887 RepID=A0ABX2M0L6_9BURK|nr:DUF1398 domain-containing protein [Herbaspirillum robiniae]NUU02935.1 DUF1398 domain-containing protein [Herbaspirillum robiniae]
MNPHTADIIDDCLQASLSGARHFGQIVAELAAAGVESYFADYRARRTTYYAGPAQRTLALPAPAVDIPARFDAGALVDAIRGAQRGEVLYPEFMARSMAAGCVGYMVWIGGRHVVYMGRDGQTHIERFPS